jgi:hypothetical protein
VRAGFAKDAVARGICGSLQSAAVMLYASNRAASSYAPTIQNQVTPTVTWMPTGSTAGTTITCAAIPTAVRN